MRITFLLPSAGREPVGGFKVVYEYANHLVARGHGVVVVHTAHLRADEPPLLKTKCLGRYVQWKITRGYGPRSWFRLDPRVRVLWVPILSQRHIPEADVVVATAWQTAEWAAAYPRTKGRKHYLIQSRETWSGAEARVMQTWNLPLRKIVIARWLLEIAEELGESATYIPNGLDFSAFGMDREIPDREPASVLMLYHTSPWKGTDAGLAALAQVREGHPELRVNVFGIADSPTGLPAWIRYHRNPPQSTLRALYNDAAIFVTPSLVEGWPLPPAEALMSGCALVATDIGGHREYAIHEHTALVSPPGEPQMMAANIQRLIENPDLRVQLARAGRDFIEQFTWDRAVTALEGVLAVEDGTQSG